MESALPKREAFDPSSAEKPAHRPPPLLRARALIDHGRDDVPRERVGGLVPGRAGEFLVSQLPTGQWVERVPYFEAVAVTGDGVFDTLKAVSKLVLKTLA